MTPRRAAWHRATVVSVTAETATARRIELEVPTWPGNEAGSHVDIRLTAPDGYQATRSYSVASSGPGTRLVLAVDEVVDGEVSPFLVRVLAVGDSVEVHGPLGRFFVWTPSADPDPAPVQLVAGGSGVVPLYAMAAAHERSDDGSEFRLLYSVRTPDDVFFRRELAALRRTRVDLVHTRSAPEGDRRPPRRLVREELDRLTLGPALAPRIFVCGSTPFVETVSRWLLEAGHAPAAVRTERFGGSG
ncbi:FAD-binding oxidoreductase [Desertihabitans aurantiacus]|uniref:FAD-binding oxidoreductase n=1 Tax=Desertihabitans aurantiacus TaxID=2282477 RepID=UPI000DF78F58|nr:FAD-binding oxidoreductase [Desertihabitans aurantiacus]